MRDVFNFKKFSVYQDDCAMKVNTDGVLLALLASDSTPHEHILDIGTGTGVVALICAQRFSKALIDAVEIDQKSAATASVNFKNSIFNARLNVCPLPFQSFDIGEKKYDLIISNPPFFLNSLKNQNVNKAIARHASLAFFDDLLVFSIKSLSIHGSLTLILPIDIASFVIQEGESRGLFLNREIAVLSYAYSKPHRKIISLSKLSEECVRSQFVIYEELGSYTEEYQNLLRDYFTIF